MQQRTGAITSLDDPSSLLAPAEQRFRDRHDAGRRLAALLDRFRDTRPIVVGMPRGGVPVAAEVARRLGAPLDVALVRKVGAPENPEYALGAVAEGGVRVISEPTAQALGLSATDLAELVDRAERELSDAKRRYRNGREPMPLTGRTVILVDDGLATGRSALAAIRSLRRREAARVILAVPVAAPQSVRALEQEVDDIVCVEMPPDLWGVGLWYDDFAPTSDEEVRALLAELSAGAGSVPDGDTGGGDRAQAQAARQAHRVSGAADPSGEELMIELGSGLELGGTLTIPAQPAGLVVFAHGSGSSRFSTRNRAVANELVASGYATLLFDLLTTFEERDRANVFDIPLLASRLVAVSRWVRKRDALADAPLAFFGASTGAAAALTAAAELGEEVRAVVSRGGRPDLALDLAAVKAPTLLIVGGADLQVLELNREAQRQLHCANELAIVAGATHLFEEPGALEEVSRLAIDWLERHLGRQAAAA